MGKNNKRKTTEQFKQEVFSLVGEEYSVIGEYINAKTNMEFLHNKCGYHFNMNPTNFISGQRCPECMKLKNIIRITNNKKNTNYFKQEVYSLVQDEYTVIGEYINAHEKLLFKHNVCNKNFYMTPSHFLSGQRCTNKECLHNRWSNACMNSDNFYREFKKYEECYEIIGDYNGYQNNMKFKHKVCGNIFTRSPNNFITLGDRCPKCSSFIYKGENEIEKVLNQKAIYFIPQKSFDDLKGINDGLLSYDFYLPQYNLLIEFQGEQHEKPIEHFGGQEKFKVQQEHDNRKREYAKIHEIQLLEIWYWDFNNIEKVLNDTFSKINMVA